MRKAADQVRIGVELVDASTGTEKWTAALRPAAQGHLCGAGRDREQGRNDARPAYLKLEEVEAPHQGGTLHGRPPTSKHSTICFGPRNIGIASAKTIMRRRASGSRKRSSLDPKYAEAYAFLAADLSGSLYCSGGVRTRRRTWPVHPNWRRRLCPWMTPMAWPSSELCEIDYLQRRFEQAVAEGERCVTTNPNLPACYTGLSDALAVSNEPEEALRAAEKAMRSGPHALRLLRVFYCGTLCSDGALRGSHPVTRKGTSRRFPATHGLIAILVVAYTARPRCGRARSGGRVDADQPEFCFGEPTRTQA